MSRSTGEIVILLEDDEWILRSPSGEVRVAHEDSPASALEAISSETVGRGARLTVIVGDRWVRYLILHWPDTVRSDEERAGFAAHRFREVHEIDDTQWVIQVDRDAADFPALACAVPLDLVRSLRGFAVQRGARISFMTSEFVHRYNHFRRFFVEPRGKLAVLVIVRQARITAGLWRDGGWLSLRSRLWRDSAASELNEMLSGWRAEFVPEEEGVVYYAGFDESAGAGAGRGHAALISRAAGTAAVSAGEDWSYIRLEEA